MSDVDKGIKLVEEWPNEYKEKEPEFAKKCEDFANEAKKQNEKKKKKTIFATIVVAVGGMVIYVVNHVLHKKNLKIATENGIEKGITATLLCGEYKSRTTGMPMIFSPDEEGHDTMLLMSEQVFNAHVNAAAMCKKED